jgi:DNA-binding XRE family transcriptional regulator
MNKALLRSIMTLHRETNKDLAQLLNVTEQTISAKMNETGTEFKQGEIATIALHYNLTTQQLIDIFFAQQVSYPDTI